MKYKHLINEYKEHTKGVIKQCEMVFEAFGDVPEPTDDEREQVYNALKEELFGKSQAEINLRCAIEYAQFKYEQQVREKLKNES